MRFSLIIVLERDTLLNIINSKSHVVYDGGLFFFLSISNYLDLTKNIYHYKRFDHESMTNKYFKLLR